MKWSDDHHLRVGETDFVLTTDRSTWEVNDSEFEHFVLLKDKALVENLLRFAPAIVENIVDLGIFKGGSVALLTEIFSPTHLVGIDSETDRVEALDEFIALHSLSESVRLYYNTRQGHRERLLEIYRVNFGTEPLDIVVDDCSHMYGPSKRSLNFLLPRIRPGGLYVIEDWGWAHWDDEYWQGTAHGMTNEETAMTTLILELVMVAAGRPGLISEITMRDNAAYLIRGDEIVSDVNFDISESYVTAGRRILHSPETTTVSQTRQLVRRLRKGLHSRRMRI